MKLLFLGDIVGRPGRKMLKNHLPSILAELQPDLVIANGENLAGGVGINRKTLQEMRTLGIEFFTGGNHTFDNENGLELISDLQAPLLRPANLPHGTPGRGFQIVTTKSGERVLIISLLGRTFMSQMVDCPFRTLDRLLQEIDPSSYDASLVDFHAEATSEKAALKFAFDGRVSAVLGTHTHVATADADVSPLGTGFITDVGMNGSLDSCIGVKSELIIKKFMTQLPVTYELMDSGRMQLSAVLIDVGSDGKTRSMELIRRIF